jgi:ABC-type thiamine transport system ATPase subunit
LRIPLAQRVGTLSGSQRAQLALTLAKRPRLLLLDEPVAALDPLARRNFLTTLTSAVAGAGGRLTVEHAHKVVQTAATAQLSTLLVRLNGPVADPAYQAEDVALGEDAVADRHAVGSAFLPGQFDTQGIVPSGTPCSPWRSASPRAPWRAGPSPP